MSNPLSRRDLIQSGALALGAFAVGGCTGATALTAYRYGRGD